MLKPLIPTTLFLISTLSSYSYAQGGCVAEDFEAFNVGAGLFNATGVSHLDEFAILAGQGPGLVQGGCTYWCSNGGIQWNGDGYYGMTTKTINAVGVPDGKLHLRYDTNASQISFDLWTFAGFPDTVTVRAYDNTGLPLFYQNYVLWGVGGAQTVTIPATDVKSVEIDGSNLWSPMIDNHSFCPTVGGPTLHLVGVCGYPISGVAGLGMTPGGTVAVAYSFQAGSLILPGGPCAGTTIGITNPTLATLRTANGVGDWSYTLQSGLPLGACGNVHVQAIDVTTCALTPVLAL